MVPYALLMGLLLPMATFFNIQSITVPSWVHLAWNNTLNDHASSPQPHGIFTLLVISWVSVGFGVLGTGALFVRMLERKIKWATRLMLLGAFCQGILASFACITLVVWALGPDNDGQLPVRYSEGIAFGLLGAMSSLTVACLGFYQLHLNKGQLYEWTLYQLSPSQRQVTLLLIATITYIVMGGLLYSSIEGWDFDDATYWAVVTFTTIGFGDLVPKTILGKLLLPIFAPIGVVLVAFNIYAVREVALELITLQLAEYFSKHFSSAGISPSSEDSIPHHPFRAPHRSYSTGMGLSHHHPHRHSDHRSTRFSRARSLSVDASSSSTSALDDTISSSAPSLFTDVHPSDGPSNLLVIPDPSSPVDDEQSPLLTPRRRRKLLRASTTSALLSSNEPRTLLLSRGANFPNLTITGDMTTLRRRLVVDVTQETFQRGITNALAVVLANTFFFGALFAYFEKWNFLEGLYFTYVALMSIGYGDYVPRTVQSRSIFIWFIFIGVASITYLGSLLAERALNQWTLTVKLIERRVDRYERKARIKKLYLKDRENAAAMAASGKGSASPLEMTAAEEEGVRRRRRMRGMFEKGIRQEPESDESLQSEHHDEVEKNGASGLEITGAEEHPEPAVLDRSLSSSPSEHPISSSPVPLPSAPAPINPISSSLSSRSRTSPLRPPSTISVTSPTRTATSKPLVQRGQTIHIDAETGSMRVSPRLRPAKPAGVLRRLLDGSRAQTSAILPPANRDMEEGDDGEEGRSGRKSWVGFFRGSGSMSVGGSSESLLRGGGHITGHEVPIPVATRAHPDSPDPYDDDSDHPDADVLSDESDEEVRPTLSTSAGATSTRSGGSVRTAGPVRIFTKRRRRTTLGGGGSSFLSLSLPFQGGSGSSSNLGLNRGVTGTSG